MARWRGSWRAGWPRLAGPGGWHLPGTGALARARRRLGPAPLRVLFAACWPGRWLAGTRPGAWAFGRLLAALDGTTLDVPYSAANIAAFGAPPGAEGRAGGWPQVRLLSPDGLRHPRDHRRGVPRLPRPVLI